MKLKKAVDGLAAGACVEVIATDAGFPRDAQAWANSTGNRVVDVKDEGGYHTVTIEKGGGLSAPTGVTPALPGNKTLIMFSDDLDRALATFVLANGAAATGKKVSIFFTFWGSMSSRKNTSPV
jgi:TusA-related sulfurtransferase